ncbi:MAG: OmpA family protein [Microscillaceae bacterium]|nr:OmpA family protein [Microscillaceae bacterium]
MPQQQNWKNYFEKAWEVQSKRKSSQLSTEELKKIALESGMSEEEWKEVQKAFQAYLQRGKSYLEHKNWKDALEEFEEAHKINPHHADLLCQLALTYQQRYEARKWMKNAHEAIRYAEDCLEVDPKHQQAPKIVTELKNALKDQKTALFFRGIRLGILTIVAAVIIYYWQPLKTKFKTDWHEIKEYFAKNQEKKGSTFVLQEVTFAAGQSILNEASKQELNRLAQYLKDHPQVRGEISGHSDDTGDKHTNLFVSEQRAKAVYDYLILQGIAANRLEYKGYGDQKPKVPNTDEASRAQNRRIEFKIL